MNTSQTEKALKQVYPTKAEAVAADEFVETKQGMKTILSWGLWYGMSVAVSPVVGSGLMAVAVGGVCSSIADVLLRYYVYGEESDRKKRQRIKLAAAVDREAELESIRNKVGNLRDEAYTVSEPLPDDQKGCCMMMVETIKPWPQRRDYALGEKLDTVLQKEFPTQEERFAKEGTMHSAYHLALWAVASSAVYEVAAAVEHSWVPGMTSLGSSGLALIIGKCIANLGASFFYCGETEEDSIQEKRECVIDAHQRLIQTEKRALKAMCTPIQNFINLTNAANAANAANNWNNQNLAQ